MRRTLQLMRIGLLLAGGWGLQAGEGGAATNRPAAIALEKPLAIEKEEAPGPTVSADVSLRSAYLSRGQVCSDHPVVQPQVVVSKFGFNAGFWANSELTDRSIGRTGVSEIDLSLNYELPVQPVDVFIGLIEYLYPGDFTAAGDDGTEAEVSIPATREVFVAAEWANPWVTPGLDIYYDFGRADGFYLRATLQQGFGLAPGLTLWPGLSAGWGSRGFNEYFYGADMDALNDGNLFAKLEYAWRNGVKLGADLVYTWLWDGEIRERAGEIYRGQRQLHGGVTLAYEF